MERRTFVLSFSLCCMCLLLIAGCGHSKDPVISKAEKMPYDFKLPTWLPFQPESKKVQHDDHFTVIYKKEIKKSIWISSKPLIKNSVALVGSLMSL